MLLISDRVLGDQGWLTLRARTLVEDRRLRAWAVEAVASLAIIGGLLAAPVLVALAWIGMLLPLRNGLHQSAPTFFMIALCWMLAAIIGAHIHARRAPRDGDEADA